MSRLKASDGFIQLSVCRGRPFNSSATASPSVRSPQDPPRPQPRVVIRNVGPRGQTTAIAAGQGSIWVAAYGVPGGEGHDGGAVQRTDPSSQSVVATIPATAVPGWEEGGGGMVFGAGSIWVVGTGRSGGGRPQALLDRIDPVTNAMRARLPLGGSYGADVAVSAAGIWVAVGGTGHHHGQVVVVDPATDAIAGRVTLPESYVRRIAAAGSSVVVNEYEWDASGGPYAVFTVIDPATLKVTGTYFTKGSPVVATGLLVRGGRIYGVLGDGIAPVDEATGGPEKRRSRSKRGHGPRGFVIATEQGFWYGAYPGGNGARADRPSYLDASSGKVSTFGNSGGMAGVILDDSMWTLLWEGDIWRTRLGSSS